MRCAVLLFDLSKSHGFPAIPFYYFYSPLFKDGILGIDHAGSWINLFNILSVLAHST